MIDQVKSKSNDYEYSVMPYVDIRRNYSNVFIEAHDFTFLPIAVRVCFDLIKGTNG
jgi:hypothetical protein